MKKRKILVCPLDWGLGHATRCIPIIHELLARGNDVSIASSGGALDLLKLEFPTLTTHRLTAYKVVYSRDASLVGRIALQIPRIRRVIRDEHQELDDIIVNYGIEYVISDNRFGCWSDRVPSVMMTHQINIRLPFWISWFANAVNHRYLKKFSKVWIPDWEGENALTGVLSENPPVPVQYLGALSRFVKIAGVQNKYKILALISGPEPQRAIFEELIESQLRKLNIRALIVRGLPGVPFWKSVGNLEIVSHLISSELNEAILASDIILCRSGYTSIMDLAALGKHAIFVPTPGQAEQEYLGQCMMKKKIGYCVAQSGFDLESALVESGNYSGFPEQVQENAWKEVLTTAQL